MNLALVLDRQNGAMASLRCRDLASTRVTENAIQKDKSGKAIAQKRSGFRISRRCCGVRRINRRSPENVQRPLSLRVVRGELLDRVLRNTMTSWFAGMQGGQLQQPLRRLPSCHSADSLGAELPSVSSFPSQLPLKHNPVRKCRSQRVDLFILACVLSSSEYKLGM